METSQIETVIDKLADKLGVAVEQMTPIAYEYLDQYQNKNLFFFLFCIVLLTGGALLVAVFGRRALLLTETRLAEQEKVKGYIRASPDEVVGYALGIAGLIMFVVCLLANTYFLGRYMAPLTYIINLK